MKAEGLLGEVATGEALTLSPPQSPHLGGQRQDVGCLGRV